jgi:hypothetical protein
LGSSVSQLWHVGEDSAIDRQKLAIEIGSAGDMRKDARAAAKVEFASKLKSDVKYIADVKRKRSAMQAAGTDLSLAGAD